MNGPPHDRRRPGAAAIAALALALFVALAGYVVTGESKTVDEFVRSAVHQTASPFLTDIAFGLSMLGSLAVIISLFVVLAAWFLVKGHRDAAIMLTGGMAGAIVLNNLLKWVFHRPRPQPFFGTDPETYSFPSGHALFSACFYGLILFVIAPERRFSPALRPLAIVLVCLIGWSRIYLGVHYFTDVIAGVLVAVAWIAALSASFPFKSL